MLILFFILNIQKFFKWTYFLINFYLHHGQISALKANFALKFMHLYLLFSLFCLLSFYIQVVGG